MEETPNDKPRSGTLQESINRFRSQSHKETAAQTDPAESKQENPGDTSRSGQVDTVAD
jgi:hypothetical protein